MTWPLVAVIVIVALFFTVFFGAPYVPARMKDLRQALDDLYELSFDDTVLDLGSGDGRVLREAARRGATAVGYELHPLLVGISRWLSRRHTSVTIRHGNYLHMKFPDATTVVYVFGDSRDIKKITRLIEREATRLQRELRVISYGFALPGYTRIKEAGAHNLYRVAPLQVK